MLLLLLSGGGIAAPATSLPIHAEDRSGPRYTVTDRSAPRYTVTDRSNDFED